MSATPIHLPRVGWLLRHALRQRGPLVGSLLLAGMLVYLAVYLLLSYQGMTEERAIIPSLLVVFGAGLGGIGLASAAFHERQARPMQDFHLALPVTRLELLAVQCLLLGVIYPLAVFVAYTLAAASAPHLAGLFFANTGSFAWAEHLRRYWQWFVPGLLVYEAIWLLGSAYFRPNALGKTAAAASVAAFCVAVSVFVAGYAALTVSSRVLGCRGLGLFTMSVGVVSVSAEDTVRQTGVVAGKAATEPRLLEQVQRQERLADDRTAAAFRTAMKAAKARWLPWGTRQSWWGRLVVLPLFCLVVTYIRLREQEA